MSSTRIQKCKGCAAQLSKPHKRGCRFEVCWKTRQRCVDCQHCQQNPPYPRERFPFTGDLESVFALQNQHHVGADVDEFDFWPLYQDGRLVGLEANSGACDRWQRIEASSQSRILRDISFRMPYLAEQTTEDCVKALRHSPLLARLHVLQFGIADREWEATMHCTDVTCESNDTEGFVGLIEQAHSLRELYAAVHLSNPNLLLAARFPPSLNVLLVGADKRMDLSVLAQNSTLVNLRTLILHQADLKVPSARLCKQVKALVNSAELDRAEELRISSEGEGGLDDDCCEAVATSRMVKHLRRLSLSGKAITDAGAAVLSASSDVRALEEVYLYGPDLTAKGIRALSAAGVRLSLEMANARAKNAKA